MAEPVLVLLNGIPGSGKSTLARAWAGCHSDPLALAVDIDVVRSMLGRWSDDAPAAGLAARAMVLAAVGVHLRAGHDVVVPQYLRREDFIDGLEQTAKDAGARFVECVLVVDGATAASRLGARAAAAGPGVEGDLSEPVEVVHADFDAFLARRPDAVPIAEATVEGLRSAIHAARPSSSDVDLLRDVLSQHGVAPVRRRTERRRGPL